jgi:hypothetical protein
VRLRALRRLNHIDYGTSDILEHFRLESSDFGRKEAFIGGEDLSWTHIAEMAQAAGCERRVRERKGAPIVKRVAGDLADNPILTSCAGEDRSGAKLTPAQV